MGTFWPLVVVCIMLLASAQGRHPAVQNNNATFNCTSQSVEARFPESYVMSVVPEGAVSLVFLDRDSNPIQQECPTRYEWGAYIAESRYGLCAAERNEIGDEIVEKYKILLTSTFDDDSSQLISQSFERTVVDFECRFPALAVVTLGRALIPAISLMHVDMGSQQAEFTLKMDRYVSSNFTTISTDNTILQGSTIYIALALEGDSDLTMQANDCNVSALEDGSGPTSFPLLVDGCPEFGPDEFGATLYPKNSSNFFGFSFPAFRWRSVSEEQQRLWVSCTATVCTKKSESCLEACDVFGKRRRSTNSGTESEASTRLSLGPFEFQNTACDKDFLECSHRCTVNRMGNGVCSCPAGYILLDDGKTCLDDRLFFRADTLLVIFGLILIFLIMLFIWRAWLVSKHAMVTV